MTEVGWRMQPTSSAEQPRELVADNPVAFARTGLQRRAVQNGNHAPLVTDRAVFLKGMKHLCHAGTPYAQHQREKLVGQRELVGLDSVVARQQPTAAALRHRVQAIASRGLHDLREEGAVVAKQQPAERIVPAGFLLQHLGPHPQRFARRLNEIPAEHGVDAEQDRYADHPLVAYRPDFDGAAVPHERDDGRQASPLGKICVLDRRAGFVEDLP